MTSPSPAIKPAEGRASPSLSANNALAGTKRKRPSERKFYAVKEGKVPGVYDTWAECLNQVRGHRGASFKGFHTFRDAQAFIEGKPLASSNLLPGEQKYYAVQNGRKPGVYTDWPSAQAQIRGVSHPRHKKFNTRLEAEAFVAAGKHNIGLDAAQTLSPEEEIRRLIVRKSAPGLQTNDTQPSKGMKAELNDIGTGPLPPGTEDGFDPNIRLAEDGTVVQRSEQEKAKTKTVIKERTPPGMLRIYTDGSSLRNGTAGARAGVGVFFGPQDPKNVSEALKGSKQTNQRAELTAIQRALDIAPRHRDVTIYTDSKYAIDCVTNWYRNWVRNGWTNSKGKPVENKDLVMAVREKIEERDALGKGTYFVWVKGHAGDKGNEEADRLANAGALLGRGVNNAEGPPDGEDRDDIDGVLDETETTTRSDGITWSTSVPDGYGESEDVRLAFEEMKRAMGGDSGDDL